MWLITVLLGTAGCETNVDPFEESNLYYSVFGFLDAATDTQFVRIRPIEGELAQPAGPLDATVLLENVVTGEVAVFRDSVLHFDEGAAHLFWAKTPVVHGTPYRLTVRRSDGAASTALTTVPPAYPAPVLTLHTSPFTLPENTPYSIEMPGVERVADVRLVFRVRDPAAPDAPFVHVISLLNRVARQAGGYAVSIVPYDLFFAGTFAKSCPVVLDAEVMIAAAGPDWPNLVGIDDETLNRPDLISNVENGVGYFGAVSSTVVSDSLLAGILAGTSSFCAECAAGSNHWRCRF